VVTTRRGRTKTGDHYETPSSWSAQVPSEQEASVASECLT